MLPTRTIPQGLAAMLAFDPDVSAERNQEAMMEAAGNVDTGLVTFAARIPSSMATTSATGTFWAEERQAGIYRERPGVRLRAGGPVPSPTSAPPSSLSSTARASPRSRPRRPSAPWPPRSPPTWRSPWWRAASRVLLHHQRGVNGGPRYVKHNRKPFFLERFLCCHKRFPAGKEAALCPLCSTWTSKN